MSKITESTIEELVIDLFRKQGYHYIYAPDIAPDCDKPERHSFEDVLLIERLQTAVSKINPTIPADIRQEAVKQILRLNSPELIANNERFHRLLTEGVNVSYQKDLPAFACLRAEPHRQDRQVAQKAEAIWFGSSISRGRRTMNLWLPISSRLTEYSR